MKRLIIGDIHGCYDDMQRLLDRAGLADDDEIIAIGDIVDRGPASPEVLTFFTTHARAWSLQGNHVRACGGELAPALSWKLSEALLLHGYYEPGVPPAAQRASVLVGALSSERYLARRLADRPWYAAYTGDKPLIVGHQDYLQNGQPLV